MGCRAQVKIEDTGVYLYTHWDGKTIADTVFRAITKGRQRWDDPDYLARIIFCEMVKDDIDGCAGYGISTAENADNEWLVRVSCRDRTVKITECNRIHLRCISFDNIARPIALGYPEAVGEWI